MNQKTPSSQQKPGQKQTQQGQQNQQSGQKQPQQGQQNTGGSGHSTTQRK